MSKGGDSVTMAGPSSLVTPHRVYVAAGSQRDGMVDALRWIGSIGIVVFHIGMYGGWIGYAALPMFVTFLVLFGCDRPIAERATRLMIPWVGWSVLYGLVKLGDAITAGIPLREKFHLWMVLTGPSLHLWFLPFCVLFLALAKRLNGWSLAVVGTVVSVGALWISNTFVLPIPLAQWSFALPAAFLGLYLARSPWPARVAAFHALTWAIAWALGWAVAAPQLAIASACIALVQIMPLIPESTVTRWMASMSLGVYLVHPLFFSVLSRLDYDGVALLSLVIILSHAATMAIKRYFPILVR